MNNRLIIFLISSLLTISSCSRTTMIVHKNMVNKDNIPLPDKNPEYDGGWDAYEKYIKKNLRYPAADRRNRIQGEAQVSFIVRKTGQITDVMIEKGVSPGIDNEAVRLISGMPNWIPAIKDGQPVSIKLTIPIIFKID